MEDEPISAQSVYKPCDESYLEADGEDGHGNQNWAPRQLEAAAPFQEPPAASTRRATEPSPQFQAMFDVFRGRYGQGEVLWVAAVQGAERAKQQMEQIAMQKPGAYFIFSAQSQAVVAEIDTTKSEVQ